MEPTGTHAGALCESRCGYLANYRNITQGFRRVAPMGGGGVQFYPRSPWWNSVLPLFNIDHWGSLGGHKV